MHRRQRAHPNSSIHPIDPTAKAFDRFGPPSIGTGTKPRCLGVAQGAWRRSSEPLGALALGLDFGRWLLGYARKRWRRPFARSVCSGFPSRCPRAFRSPGARNTRAPTRLGPRPVKYADKGPPYRGMGLELGPARRLQGFETCLISILGSSTSHGPAVSTPTPIGQERLALVWDRIPRKSSRESP